MHLNIYDHSYIQKLTRTRAGETKLGERVQTIDSKDIEQALKNSDAKFVLLGIPEDIGVRANFGRGGAHTAWHPALSNILNIQNNEFIDGSEILVLGHIEVDDLMQASEKAGLEKLRGLVEEVDQRVVKIIQTIVASGKIPVIIGGGHNNSYGNIKGAALGLQTSGKIKQAKINCINSDAHTDFRALEGRHSGNGFSYAYNEGFLKNYAIVGLHENYNAQAVLDELKKHIHTINYTFFEDIFVQEDISFKHTQQPAAGISDHASRRHISSVAALWFML